MRDERAFGSHVTPATGRVIQSLWRPSQRGETTLAYREMTPSEARMEAAKLLAAADDVERETARSGLRPRH